MYNWTPTTIKSGKKLHKWQVKPEIKRGRTQQKLTTIITTTTNQYHQATIKIQHTIIFDCQKMASKKARQEERKRKNIEEKSKLHEIHLITRRRALRMVGWLDDSHLGEWTPRFCVCNLWFNSCDYPCVQRATTTHNTRGRRCVYRAINVNSPRMRRSTAQARSGQRRCDRAMSQECCGD